MPESPAGDAGGAEIIIIDCSGSMGSPQAKIAEARAATSAAVDVIRDGVAFAVIRDGVAFAVIAGTSSARPVFAADGSLAIADGQTRQAAQRAVAGLRPGGGPRSASGCGWRTRCSARIPPRCGTPSCSPGAHHPGRLIVCWSCLALPRR